MKQYQDLVRHVLTHGNKKKTVLALVRFLFLAIKCASI